MPVKDLLERQPLYKSVNVVLPVQRHRWPRPAIKAVCGRCGSEQTYTVISKYSEYDEADPKPGSGGYMPAYSRCVRIVYQCAGCEQSRRYFLVLVLQKPRRGGGSGAGLPPATESEAVIQKVGQYPPWDIAPDPGLAGKLGDRTTIYKKGLICESQGFGIAAYAYYRRIIEQIVDELLEEIHQLISPEEAPRYAEALERARSSHRAVDKIEQVKDLIPSVLRPGGANPLLLLHGALSQGIHQLPDEHCLELASTIRGALVFLVHQVNQAKTSKQQFEKDLKALLDRQAKQGLEEDPT